MRILLRIVFVGLVVYIGFISLRYVADKSLQALTNHAMSVVNHDPSPEELVPNHSIVSSANRVAVDLNEDNTRLRKDASERHEERRLRIRALDQELDMQDHLRQDPSNESQQLAPSSTRPDQRQPYTLDKRLFTADRDKAINDEAAQDMMRRRQAAVDLMNEAHGDINEVRRIQRERDYQKTRIDMANHPVPTGRLQPGDQILIPIR